MPHSAHRPALVEGGGSACIEPGPAGGAKVHPTRAPGGTSYKDAPVLGSGVWTDTIRSSETTIYYRVRVGWGNEPVCASQRRRSPVVAPRGGLPARHRHHLAAKGRPGTALPRVPVSRCGSGSTPTNPERTRVTLAENAASGSWQTYALGTTLFVAGVALLAVAYFTRP